MTLPGQNFRPELGQFDTRQAESYAWSNVASPVCRDNFDRTFAFSGVVPIGATQVMASFGIVLYAGDIISNIAFRSGTVGAGTPTNWWFALYNPLPTAALMAQTADQLTAAWAANTTIDLPLTTPQTIPSTGLYYAAIMVKATTPPNMNGSAFAAASVAMSGGLVTGQGVKGQTSGSGLTTTAPATIATPSLLNGVAYVVCH